MALNNATTKKKAITGIKYIPIKTKIIMLKLPSSLRVQSLLYRIPHTNHREIDRRL